ncbi:MAG: LrgB family protein [Synergistaceae bacterium]|jgi:putative effector of murein hydrolase|nr:LrgB family protein [Synergistaceae bacterium]
MVTGVAIVTFSNAVGTARALELGETEEAMSAVAIGVTGVATVLIAILD